MKKMFKESSLLGLLGNYLDIKVSKNVKKDLDGIMDFLNIVTDALIICFVQKNLSSNGNFFSKKNYS